MVKGFSIRTRGQGLYEVTDEVGSLVRTSGVAEGLCTVFIRHTSASLTIQENADPSARADLEAWLNQLVPERDPLFTHTAEGPDDMPSHIKSILTDVSLSIPILNWSSCAWNMAGNLCMWNTGDMATRERLWCTVERDLPYYIGYLETH